MLDTTQGRRVHIRHTDDRAGTTGVIGENIVRGDDGFVTVYFDDGGRRVCHVDNLETAMAVRS